MFSLQSPVDNVVLSIQMVYPGGIDGDTLGSIPPEAIDGWGETGIRHLPPEDFKVWCFDQFPLILGNGCHLTQALIEASLDRAGTGF